MLVESITTQGQSYLDQWVTQYLLSYRYDESTPSFQVLQDRSGNDVVFNGNSDRNSKVVNAISPPFVARYVRILPKGWELWPSLRWELYGCRYSKYFWNLSGDILAQYVEY